MLFRSLIIGLADDIVDDGEERRIPIWLAVIVHSTGTIRLDETPVVEEPEDTEPGDPDEIPDTEEPGDTEPGDPDEIPDTEESENAEPGKPGAVMHVDDTGYQDLLNLLDRTVRAIRNAEQVGQGMTLAEPSIRYRPDNEQYYDYWVGYIEFVLTAPAGPRAIEKELL